MAFNGELNRTELIRGRCIKLLKSDIIKLVRRCSNPHCGRYFITEINSLRSVQWQTEHLFPPKATQESWRGPLAAPPLYLTPIYTSFTAPHLPRRGADTSAHTCSAQRLFLQQPAAAHPHLCPGKLGEPSWFQGSTAALVLSQPIQQHRSLHSAEPTCCSPYSDMNTNAIHIVQPTLFMIVFC